MPVYIEILRPKQWTKNIVVLAGFIFGLGDAAQSVALQQAWIALAAALLFCLVSGAVYILNDIKDIEKDRMHPVKKNRPLPSGRIGVTRAAIWAAILLTLSLVASYLLSPPFFGTVMAYVVLQAAYTLILKRVELVDIFIIAIGFVLRALAGAFVLDIDISPWLLLCTLLLALFLALCKRRHEKVVLSDSADASRPTLEHYSEKLLDQLIAIVSASTVVCYALYTLWPDTVEKFGTTHLGFTIPFVLFGMFRYLDLVYRHDKGGRPEQILLTDLPLLIDMALYGIAVLYIFLQTT